MTFPQPHRPETDAEREARLAWEREGSTLAPPVRRAADRVVTVLLLVFGAIFTVLAGIIGFIAAIYANEGRASLSAPILGAIALGVGGAFIIGVAAAVLSIAAWIKRRSSWWIAALGFVLAAACIAIGGALFAQNVDQAPGGQSITAQGSANGPALLLGQSVR